MTPTATVWRLTLFGLAIAVWLASFSILSRAGTWTPFAIGGVALAGVVLWADAETRALLRPSVRTIVVGLVAGVVMVALTHAAFALAAPRLPEVRSSTVQLFDLLRVGGVAPEARAGLIVVIASCEEIIFRGALLGSAGRGDLFRVVALAAGYALAMVTLGNRLLVFCAFGCALVWGALRVASRSLVVPIVCHVVWNLGVLVVWPIVR